MDARSRAQRRSDATQRLYKTTGDMVTTSLSRVGRVTSVSLRGGVGALTGSVGAGSLHKIVATLGELKGVPMKIGQLLSYVDSSLAEDTRAELSALQTHSQPMPTASVLRILREELGAAAAPILQSLEPVPIASASIGQVHRARLPDGTAVAVKIQYPGMVRAIENDFGPAKLAGGMVTLLYPALGADRFVREARDRILEECDYRAEALHHAELAAWFADHPVITIPQVHHAYCTGRVLTTSLAPGLHLDDYLATEPSQAERDRFGAALVDFYVGTLLRRHVLPGDPHPGNYLFGSGGRLAILDHACTRTLDAAGNRLARVTLALEAQTRARVYDAVAELGGEALLVLRIRYGLASVLARLGVRARWSQLIARHGIGPGGAEVSGEITTWDADASANAAPGTAPTAAGSGQVRAAAPAPAAPPTFDVVLIDAGDRTIEIIREVRDLFGLGIREAKDLIDRAPRIVKQTRDRDEAEQLKRRLESSGGTVEIRTAP